MDQIHNKVPACSRGADKYLTVPNTKSIEKKHNPTSRDAEVVNLLSSLVVSNV